MLLTDACVPVGRILGRLINDHPNPIRAYSANIAGSLVGIWLFVGLSAYSAPPAIWFAILGALTLPFVPRFPRDTVLFVAMGLLVPLAWWDQQVPTALRVVWSPYQKLALLPVDASGSDFGKYNIAVNNTLYQAMADLRPGSRETLAAPRDFEGLSQYDLPALLHPNPQRYLIIGAGSGNDVAGALRHNVPHIVAVEIDPAIIAFGREFHPERPYASPAVRIVNDDARSYLARTAETFDVIAFGLLDSHTTTAMTNARLDSYVYTRESIARAKALLAPGGLMILSFEAQKPFIADRMGRLIAEIFGESPLVFRVPSTSVGWGGVMFIAGDLGTARAQMARSPDLGAFVENMQREHPVVLHDNVRVTTDDWPYTYLEHARIPTLYYLLAGLMVALWFYTTRRWKAAGLTRRWANDHWHFFFLGAAFLLLEVQNISKASVALGNTWQVNAVIVSGVLVMALLANEVARRVPRLRLGVVYGTLIASCLALYFLDLGSFAALPYEEKAIVVGALTTCPMFFSGLIFVRSFASTVARDDALGANLCGAIVGALLQSLTFVFGIRALLLVVAVLYLLSMLFVPARQIAGRSTAAA